MDLLAHFRGMWRHKWAVLIGAVVVAVVVYAVLSVQPKVYQATAELSVTANGQAAIQDATPFLAATYAALAATRPVDAAAAHLSGLGVSAATVQDRISVQVSSTVGYLEVTATGPSPAAATALARGMSQALVAAVSAQQGQALEEQLTTINLEITHLGAQLSALSPTDPRRAAVQSEYQALIQSLTTDQLQPTNQISVVSPAQAGSSPKSPKPKTYALLGLVAALVVLAELSVVYEVTADRFSEKSDEEISQLTGLPVLAHIPRGNGPELLESLRTLRTSLLFMDGSQKLHTLAVVSSAPGVGKSFVSTNLVQAFADLGLQVILVDGDMRRPAIDVRLKVNRSPGLSEILFGAQDMSAGLRSCQTPDGNSYSVLPAGAAVADPAGLLTSQLLDRAFNELASYDVVVVDTPADSRFPDASIIAASCDATLTVIDASHTKRRSLRVLLDHLERIRAKPIGIVINRSRVSPESPASRSWKSKVYRAD